ncbi:MAG: MBL fold metallo-hydrolase, partial [bacterium]|nr:MBL fold metallo-hydrolase [bacterium]
MRQENLETNVLPLKSDTGELKIFFVGVGSAFSKLNNQTNLVIVKKETSLLIDCGTKTPQALFNLGHPVTDFNNILITHSHADHIGGMEECLLNFRYFAKRKVNLITTKEYKSIMWNYSLKGGSGFNERHNETGLKLTDFCNIILPKKITKFPREGYETDLDGLNIKMFRTKHIPDNAKSW